MTYAHILVALDGSRLPEQILPHVESLAEKFHSRVTLCSAGRRVQQRDRRRCSA